MSFLIVWSKLSSLNGILEGISDDVFFVGFYKFKKCYIFKFDLNNLFFKNTKFEF